jgi:hypothetical protein
MCIREKFYDKVGTMPDAISMGLTGAALLTEQVVWRQGRRI